MASRSSGRPVFYFGSDDNLCSYDDMVKVNPDVTNGKFSDPVAGTNYAKDERVRLLHEVGKVLERNFAGKIVNSAEECGKFAVSLVPTTTRHFPGFRDHIYSQLIYGEHSSAKDMHQLGSEGEVESRACFIFAVEKMRELIKSDKQEGLFVTAVSLRLVREAVHE